MKRKKENRFEHIERCFHRLTKDWHRGSFTTFHRGVFSSERHPHGTRGKRWSFRGGASSQKLWQRRVHRVFFTKKERFTLARVAPLLRGRYGQTFLFSIHRNSKAITQPKTRLSKGSKLGATWKWYNTLTGLVLTQRDRFSAMKFRPERFHVVAKRPRLLRNAYLRCSSPSNRFHDSFRFLPSFRRFDQFFSSSLFFFFSFSALFRRRGVNGLNFPSQLRPAGWNRREY